MKIKNYKTTSLYNRKVLLVKKLIKENKKHFDDNDIINAGKEFDLTPESSKLAWNNFVQTGGKIDVRRTSGSYQGAIQFASRKNNGGKVNKNITTQLAGQILKRSLHSTQDIGSFCQNENISINQYYSWLKELNVSGTLLNRVVLNPRKYAKLDVKTAFWIAKHPNSKRKTIKALTILELEAYKRLIQILEKYL